VLAGRGGRCKVRVLAGEQAARTGCGEPRAGGIRVSQTSRRLPCGHGHWFREEQRTGTDMQVQTGSCIGHFAVAQQELEHTHAVGTAQEVAAWAAAGEVEADVAAAAVVACKKVAGTVETAMGHRLMAEERRFAVSEVLCLHSVAAVVVGDIAVAVGVAGPFPVEIAGVREKQQASDGSRCSRIEVWR